MPITDPAITNPAAYGRVPVIPPTSTNLTSSTSGWETGLPNYQALAALQTGNIENQLRGQLNPEDLANAQLWAAQRGITTGTGFDSPNNMAAYQHFLGLSAQQLEQQGQQNLNAALAAAPRTTTTSGSQTIDNNVLAAIYAAAPDPYAAAMANLAAQQQGLRGGAAGIGGPAGGGIGNIAPPTTVPRTDTGTQQATMDAYMNQIRQLYPQAGGTAPGAHTTGGAVVRPTVPTGYGTTPQATQAAPVTDQQGNMWMDLGDGSWINLSTGDVQMGAPGGSSIFGGISTGAGGVSDIFDPTGGLGGVFGQMPDFSQIGENPMGGLPYDTGYEDWLTQFEGIPYTGGTDAGYEDWLSQFEEPAYDYTADYAYPQETAPVDTGYEDWYSYYE